MGGLGSGRLRYRSDEIKPVIEDYVCLNFTELKRQGFITAGNHFEITYSRNQQEIMILNVFIGDGHFHLSFIHNGKFKKQLIKIATKSCFKRYTRQYFICACGALRSQIYFANTRFLCRSCHDLGYKSARMNASKRLYYMSNKIRKNKLNQPDDSPRNTFPRPANMHKEKYQRTVSKIMEYEEKSHRAFLEYFSKVTGKLDSFLSESKKSNAS